MIEAAPVFPPLFRGQVAQGDPVEEAEKLARAGVEPGLIVYARSDSWVHAALVLAPDVTREAALAMIPAAALGWADALGAHAPPELPLHIDWPSGVRLNGARCGDVLARAATNSPPDWLIVAIRIPRLPSESMEPGDDPDITSLAEEGCGDIPVPVLLESWSKHFLSWLNRWQDEGMRPLHADLLARLWKRQEATTISIGGVVHQGTLTGMDETCGALLTTPDGTTSIPLSVVLETPSR